MTTEASTYTGTDLWLPRVCVQNHVTASVLSADTAATGYEAEAVRGPQTYTGWKPTALPGYLYSVFSSASINYVGMYVSDPQGCTFRARYWDGAAYVQVGIDVAMTEPGLILWLFDALTTTRVSIAVVSGTDEPIIATLKAGLTTVFPLGLPSGFRPAYLNPSDELTNVFSQGGQVLGSQLVSSLAKQDVSIDNVEPSWVRTNWPDVRDSMRTEGIFFAWNADDFPDETMYGGLVGVPTADYSSTLYMRVSFSIEGPRIL